MAKYFETKILMMELERMLRNMWSSHTVTLLTLVTFQKHLVLTFRRDSSACAWKKFVRTFYTSELMIHVLAEEDLLTMHSDTLWNITPGVSVV